jgi:hypothetical protein
MSCSKTCFVIMPIGEQCFNGEKATAEELRQLYDALIREAILKARPSLEVIRADDIAAPGDITTDIFERIADSDYVVADLTYPNPNVYYELGLRHATRTGTILLCRRNPPYRPFDVSPLRHIEYENTTPGLKELAESLRRAFDSYEANPGRLDNHFLKTIEPRFVLPPGGQTYQVLQIGTDGQPVWDWIHAS